MPGKKSEFNHCACVFVRRFASLPASNSPRNARSRLYAWITAIPETDSAICAVIDAIVSRTRRNAACERTWNHLREDERRRQDDECDERRGASRG